VVAAVTRLSAASPIKLAKHVPGGSVLVDDRNVPALV
jgi:hypothetical protein